MKSRGTSRKARRARASADTAAAEAAGRAAALEARAEDLFGVGDIEGAHQLMSLASGTYGALGLVEERGRCLVALGFLCERQRRYRDAECWYREAISHWTASGDERRLAIGWAKLGTVLQVVGDHDGAICAFDRAMCGFRAKAAIKELCTLLNNKAVSYRELRQTVDAVKCHERAIDLRRTIGDDEGLAASLHNLAALQMDAGLLDAAGAGLRAALKLREAMGDLPGIVSTLNRLGLLAEQAGDLKGAVTYYECAIHRAQEDPKRPELIAEPLCNLGSACIQIGQAARAIEFLQHAQTLVSGPDDTPANATIAYNLGVAYCAQGDRAAALGSLEVARRIQTALGDVQGLAATVGAISLLQGTDDRILVWHHGPNATERSTSTADHEEQEGRSLSPRASAPRAEVPEPLSVAMDALASLGAESIFSPNGEPPSVDGVTSAGIH